jgi:poly-gamma-glutamate synthesis protein (capsule biosynthesis protein)
VKLALAGDTMLGRKVGEAISARGPASVVSPDVVAVAREADLFLLNLECCISERGERWRDPRKPFFFRAPPAAVETLVYLGVDCVTLANNHALDYGPEALLDTLAHLRSARVEFVGAGANVEEARAPAVFEAAGLRLAIVGAADYPAEFAAGDEQPGIAFADLRAGSPPDWLLRAARDAGIAADAVLVTPHWGPNMLARPLPEIRSAAAALVGAGATLVAGHSAHVFQGVQGRVLYDLGDFVDDYITDPLLRNDLGLLFLVTLDEQGPTRLEGVPLKLEFCYTRLAAGSEAAWIRRRFREACAELGAEVGEENDRVVVDYRA